MPRMPMAERREALVAAAFRVIAERGVGAATTRAIAAEAGMPLASFHYAFESHTDLMAELIAAVSQSEQQTIDELFSMGPDVLENVRAALQAFITHLVREPDAQRAVLELTQYAMRTEGLEHLAPALHDLYRQRVMAMLSSATDMGIEWTTPLESIAYQVIVITDGITMAYLVDNDEDAARRSADSLAVAIAGQGRTVPV